MDGLAQVGTFLATPQMYLGFFVGLILVLGGLWFIVKQPPQNKTQKHWSDTAIGLSMILFGMMIAFAGWLKRNFIRSSPQAAAVFGALDIASFVR